MDLITPSTLTNVTRTTNMDEMNNEKRKEALERNKITRKDQDTENFSCMLKRF